MSALPYQPMDPMSQDGSPEHEGMETQGLEQQEQQQGDYDKVLPLEQIAGMGIDLAFELPDEVLGRIASQCIEAYERDKAERADWEQDYDKTAELLGGRRGQKSFPWPGASNVMYPLITTASLQFGARAYPAIVKGQDVVKVRVTGEDPDGMKRQRADRIKEHMNWQLLEDMPEWEDETDKLVHMLPWQGCLFRQAIWDKNYERPLTSLISAKRLVVTQHCKDLETVPIFCKEFPLFPHEIIERMRDGRYVDHEAQMKFDAEKEKQGEQDMLECHCRYDLDEDGYAEPWIAVIHKESARLMSLKAGFWPKGVKRNLEGKVTSVRRHVEFTKYGFVPDFEGKFLDIGFGFLLREHNEIINTIINQLLDAATDQNAGGGFIGKGVNLKGGATEFVPGEWKQVNNSGTNLRENIVPRPTAQPSPVLFQLLGVMIEAGKEVASIRDALTGEVQANQPATTTLAIIEQGLQVFSSIYKRIYRAMGKELKLLYQLNAAYLPDEAYFYVLDDQKAIAKQDYAEGDHDVSPVADPSITTSGQRLARAQFLGSFIANGPDPDINSKEVKRRMMEAAEIEDIEKVLAPDPPPEVQAEQGMLQKRAANAEVSEKEMSAADKAASADKKQAETEKIRMETKIRPFEAAAGVQALDDKARTAERKIESDERSRMGDMGGMASGPADAALPPQPQGPVEVPQIPMGGEPMGAGPAGPGLGQPPGLPGAIPGL